MASVRPGEQQPRPGSSSSLHRLRKMSDAAVSLSVAGFISGAIAACIAATFSNPAEVIKTRMQLSGELSSNKSAAVYSGPLDCATKTWRNEGLRGIQRGLGAAYTYQIALNGSRLGFFEPIRRNINRAAGYDQTEIKAWTSIVAGAGSGVVGAVFGNPLFLVKARMQAYSPFNPVGVQHAYSSAWDGLRSIVRADGLKGIFRGVDASMLRTAMGSSVQLPSYGLAKGYLKEWGVQDGPLMYLAASAFSGACVCTVMQPADTALTRMYNQDPHALRPDGTKGLLYKNPIDCLLKTWQAEGIRGLYKGTTAHLARIAPHTIITLSANEIISRYYLQFKTKTLRHD